MKPIAITLLAAVLVGKAFADPASIIKQKAKDTANQNNAQQGRPPQYPGTQSPSPKPAQPAATLTADQQAFLVVANDLITPKAEDATKLAADLKALRRNVSKSADTIQKLAKDLTAALAGKSPSATERSRIVQGVRTVMNGGSQPDSKIEPYIADVSAILKIAGVDSAAVALVNADLKTLRTETLPASVKSSGE